MSITSQLCLTGHISSQSSLVQSIGNAQLALTLMMTSSQVVKNINVNHFQQQCYTRLHSPGLSYFLL